MTLTDKTNHHFDDIWPTWTIYSEKMEHVQDHFHTSLPPIFDTTGTHWPAKKAQDDWAGKIILYQFTLQAIPSRSSVTFNFVPYRLIVV
ncbi:MAG TPA: hypothetical protein VGO47_08380 [Chlamydiales bacterium]|nr:hypothetical protein [Chlamydiales bacterium]